MIGGDRPRFIELARWGAGIAVGVVGVLASVGLVVVTRDLLVQILVALFLAVSLDPIVRWLVARRVRRPWAVLITLVLFSGLITAFIVFAVTPLVGQAGQLATDFPDYLRRTREQVGIPDRFDEYINTLPDVLVSQAAGFARRFLGAVVSVLLVTVLMIYFLLDLPRLRRGFVRLFPEPRRAGVSRGVTVVVDKVGYYMIGNIVVSLIAGTSSCAAMLALRVPFALPLAVIVAVTDLIPLIGATIGAAVCVVVSAATGESWISTVALLVFFVVYQQLENYVIVPRVLRNAVNVPSVAVLLAALIGASLLGVIGALMAIPLVAAGKALLADTRLAAASNG